MFVSRDLLVELPAFLEVANSLSFRAAAEAMEVTPAALSKAVGRLEARLGQPLLTRTTRRVALTPAGEVFRSLVAQALGLVEDGVAAVHVGPRVAGHVRVAAPASLLPVLGPPLAAMTQRHHGLWVVLTPPDTASPQRAAGAEPADLDLRIGEAAAGTGAISLGYLSAVAVASPGYAARHGLPDTWTDPAHHLWLSQDDPMFGRPGWKLSSGLPTLTSPDAAIILGAALSGAGIARLWQPLVDAHIAAGRLLRVLSGDDPSQAPVTVRLTPDAEALPRTLLVLREVVRALGLKLPIAVQAMGASASDVAAR